MIARGTRIRVRTTKETKRRRIAGLLGVADEDVGSHIFVTLPDAPDNPAALETSVWWRTHRKRYALVRRDVEEMQLGLFA